MSMAIAYNMKKKARMAQGGCVDCAAGQCHKHSQTLTKTGPGMKVDSETYMKTRGLSTKELEEDQKMACGGIVDRIMAKRMSEGGLVSNSDHGLNESELTDLKPNNFDALALEDDLYSHYDLENSGDEVGNDALDEDDRDIVSRIMKSRKLGGKMPRPA